MRTPEEKRLAKVRERSSYTKFEHFYRKMLEVRDTDGMMRLLYDVLEDWYAFGSERASFYAAESMEQVCADRGNIRLVWDELAVRLKVLGEEKSDELPQDQ